MSTPSSEKKCKNDKKFIDFSSFFKNIKNFFINIAVFFKNIFANKCLMAVFGVIVISLLSNYIIIKKYCSKDRLNLDFSGNKNRKVIKWLLIVLTIITIVAIIVFFVLYWIEYYSKNPILIRSINAKKGPVIIPNSKLLKSYTDVAYSYSFWIYVDNWSYRYNKPKWLLYKCEKPKNEKDVPLSNPTITMDSKEPKLSIVLNITTDKNGSENEVLTTPELKLQKWNHIALTIKNQDVRVYCDGELCVGKTIKGTMVLNDHPLTVVPFGGYSGQLNLLQYFNYEIDLDTIKSIASKKPNKFAVETEISKLT